MFQKFSKAIRKSKLEGVSSRDFRSDEAKVRSKTSVGTQAIITPLSEYKITPKKVPIPAIWKMTSRELHVDPEAATNIIRQNLKDTMIIETFRQVIFDNRHLFKGKNVMVLKCGVGLLALEAARAGAAKVFAIDTSNAIEYARAIVAKQGSGHIIKLIKGRVEDIELPTDEKIDVILCNWVGYFVVYDTALKDVIYARDKWLKPKSGIIFPDQAILYVALLSDPQSRSNHIDWWLNVRGFRMESIRKAVNQRPIIKLYNSDQVISSHCQVLHIDLKDAEINFENFKSTFLVVADRTDQADGIITFFEVLFSKAHVPLVLSTFPWMKSTSWRQTGFFFEKPIRVEKGWEYIGGIKMVTSPETGDVAVHFELVQSKPKPMTFLNQMSWICERTTLCMDPIEMSEG